MEDELSVKDDIEFIYGSDISKEYQWFYTDTKLSTQQLKLRTAKIIDGEIKLLKPKPVPIIEYKPSAIELEHPLLQ